MRKLSTKLLAQLITTNRKCLSLTQQALADATGINRSLISRIEKEDFLPSFYSTTREIRRNPRI